MSAPCSIPPANRSDDNAHSPRGSGNHPTPAARGAIARSLSVAAMVAVLCLAEGRTLGAPTATSPHPPSADTGSCPANSVSALQAIASELRMRLGPATLETLVVAGPVDGLPSETGRNELALRLGQVVAMALGNDASAAARTASAVEAQALAAKSGRLIYLAPKLNGAHFEVVADVSDVPRNFWARARGVKPSAVMHAFVQRPLDAELRSFLPRPALVVSRVDKAKHLVQAPIALACGDLDSDQGLEVLVIGRQELATGRIQGGRFVAGASARWNDLSPVAWAPARQVMASAWIESGRAWVGTSDRAHALVLGPDLKLERELGRLLPWPPEGCAAVDSTAILIPPLSCWERSPARTPRPEGTGVQAVAGALIATSEGAPLTVRATFDANREQAMLTDSTGRNVSVDGVGAQLAVGDLDGDGQVELVASRPTLDPQTDGLDVWTWTPQGRLVKRFAVPVPRGIAAVTVCPAEDLGLTPIVVATADELWVVR